MSKNYLARREVLIRLGAVGLASASYGCLNVPLGSTPTGKNPTTNNTGIETTVTDWGIGDFWGIHRINNAGHYRDGKLFFDLPGLRVDAPEGEKVRAIAPGKVWDAGYGKSSGYFVRAEHAGNLVVYAHLKSIYKNARKGANLAVGEEFAEVGSTGEGAEWFGVIYPHLALIVNANGLVPIDINYETGEVSKLGEKKPSNPNEYWGLSANFVNPDRYTPGQIPLELAVRVGTEEMDSLLIRETEKTRNMVEELSNKNHVVGRNLKPYMNTIVGFSSSYGMPTLAHMQTAAWRILDREHIKPKGIIVPKPIYLLTPADAVDIETEDVYRLIVQSNLIDFLLKFYRPIDKPAIAHRTGQLSQSR